MYHHANNNINISQLSDHGSVSTKSSEARRRQIPLAFANTEWGREYIANPNWEQDNLGKIHPPVRRKSRGQAGANDETTTSSSSNPTVKSTNPSAASEASYDVVPAPLPSSSAPQETSKQYSAMASWNFFRRTFPHSASPASPDTETRNSIHPEQEEVAELGSWLEMLMRWDDFEQWRLNILQRPWYSPGDTA